jgi:hypothetical protein
MGHQISKPDRSISFAKPILSVHQPKMSNKRSHSDNALPSREIKKQGRISSMEDTVHEPKIKREAEASPSVS